jgi:hypothetical protein
MLLLLLLLPLLPLLLLLHKAVGSSCHCNRQQLQANLPNCCSVHLSSSSKARPLLLFAP